MASSKLRLVVNPFLQWKTEKESTYSLFMENICTLLDKEDTLRPQRWTTLIARELAHCRINIAALSETRLAKGLICGHERGLYLLLEGKIGNEDGIHRQGFVIHTTFLCQLPNLQTGVSERFNKLCFPFSGYHHARIISAYAPTLPSHRDNKEAFNENLDSLVKFTPAS